MQLNELLSPEGIKLLGLSSSKKRLFHEIGDLAEAQFGLEPAKVIEALLERESLGPTGVGHGVALPHARLHNLDDVKGLFIRLEKPLDFDAVDRQPVDLIFVLLAPENSGVEHLKALALVSRTLREKAICSKLRANSDVATLYAILTDTTTHQAA
ncbi:PTS sugar transporter subunit IIA [Aestuariibius sp. HNIBRBA575]|uniref:PTS sugar transporter subunit IIA n=1 Tax=Aestuariibius sp. HNIBRBA575 TaxID=3233343 RepID=UPI0034A48991